jgi:hypothetical protein
MAKKPKSKGKIEKIVVNSRGRDKLIPKSHAWAPLRKGGRRAKWYKWI